MRDLDQAPEPARSAREVTAAPLGRLGHAADVLALQRRIGNAATGRWLARQTAGADTVGVDPLEANWKNVCATKVAAPAGTGPQKTASDEPIIHTVAGPCLTHWAAGYHWYVTYQMPFATPTGGCIIQELWQQGSGGSFEHFWEYWKVDAQQREPGNRIVTLEDVTPAGVPYDDRYRHGVLPGRKHAPTGWYRHRGIIRFYPGPPPSQFAPGKFQTKERPDGWTGTGARHDCYAEWERVPGKPRRLGLVATAGTEVWRAGDQVQDPGP